MEGPSWKAGVAVLSQTQREGLMEKVFYRQRCAIVFYRLMMGENVTNTVLCVWIHNHRYKVSWRGLSIPKTVLQRQVLRNRQWLPPGTYPGYFTADRRKNWPQGYAMEWQIWVAAALDLGRHWIGILGFRTRPALEPYVSWKYTDVQPVYSPGLAPGGLAPVQSLC